MAVVIGRGSLGGAGFIGSVVSESVQDDVSADIDERIASGIQRIEFNVTQLNPLVSSIGTASDSEKLRRNVHKILQDTSDLTKQTGQLIKQYTQSRPEDETEYTEWKVNSERFKSNFQNVLHQYQAIQKETRIKERTSLRQSLIQSGYHDLEISESGEITKGGQQCELEKIQEEENLKLIKEREAALKQLEKDIVDINGIFKDLADMVQEQGKDIDIAEDNIIIAEDNINDAIEELSQAHDNMVAQRKKKIAAVVIVSIIIAIVVIIIIVTQT